MKAYTPTELRNDSGSVYNEVMMNGPVLIQGKSRPDMILMTQARFDELTQEAYNKGALDEYKAVVATKEAGK